MLMDGKDKILFGVVHKGRPHEGGEGSDKFGQMWTQGMAGQRQCGRPQKNN